MCGGCAIASSTPRPTIASVGSVDSDQLVIFARAGARACTSSSTDAVAVVTVGSSQASRWMEKVPPSEMVMPWMFGLISTCAFRRETALAGSPAGGVFIDRRLRLCHRR